MKINSGLWKPDVPSPLLPILKYDFLFAMKIWNLMLGEIAMWQVAIMLSVPVTRNKSQSYKVTARSSLIDSQAGAHSTLVQRQWPGIYFGHGPDNLHRSQPGVVSTLWGWGDVMQQLLSVVTLPWSLGTDM